MSFLVYKRTDDEGVANELSKSLSDNNIEVRISVDKENLDSMYGDKEFAKQYFIRISESDFEKADLLFENLAASQLDAVDSDHYLFTFSDDELFEIVSKKDEWSDLDFQLAKKILKDRGKIISHDMEKFLKDKRIKELSKIEKPQTYWIYSGYLGALSGGFFGIFIGWHLNTHKKLLPNGQQIYAYMAKDRRHGLIIFCLGCIVFPVSLFIKFWPNG